ncbi:MAG: preprotein translocase subunit YajC [Microthrixaceae bacterium]
MISALLTSILAQEKQSGGLASILIFLPLIGVVIYMMVGPQRKQRQKQADLLRKLDVGDEVLTTGGIVGIITFVEDDLFHLEVDNDVVIRIAKSGVARTLKEPDAADKAPARGRKGLLAGALGGSKADTGGDAAPDSDGDVASVDKK